MAISSVQISQHLAALAERLRQARLDSGLTQQALADLTGVSAKTISNAEDSGQVSMDTLTRLLDGLGRLDDLERLLEDPGPSPIELARRKGKRKQRVRPPKESQGTAADTWQW